MTIVELSRDKVEYLPRVKPSCSEEAFAAEEYADYTTEVLFELPPRDKGVEYKASADGTVFRFPARLIVMPKEKVFRIRVFSGATEADVRVFYGFVRLIRAGHFARYDFQSKLDADGDLFYSRSLGYVPEQYPQRPSDWYFFRCELAECDNPEGMHSSSDDSEPCYHHRITQFDNDDYWIAIELEHGTTEWKVATQFENTNMTTEVASRFASDLAWSVAEANKRNRMLKAVA